MSGKRQRESMRLFPHSRPPFPYRQVAVERAWKGEQLARMQLVVHSAAVVQPPKRCIQGGQASVAALTAGSRLSTRPLISLGLNVALVIKS